jgi:hypothetical protein
MKHTFKYSGIIAQCNTFTDADLDYADKVTATTTDEYYLQICSRRRACKNAKSSFFRSDASWEKFFIAFIFLGYFIFKILEFLKDSIHGLLRIWFPFTFPF